MTFTERSHEQVDAQQSQPALRRCCCRFGVKTSVAMRQLVALPLAEPGRRGAAGSRQDA